jgi:uncharacterized protein YjbI with pentapeptide repeats
MSSTATDWIDSQGQCRQCGRPVLLPLRNPLIRLLSGLTFYLLLPVAMMLFAWKAAVFPTWGACLLCVATAVGVSHVMLLFSKFTWRSKALLSVATAIIVIGLLLNFGPMRRPFYLFQANLSGQWLAGVDLRNANLIAANLNNANLSYANLNDAILGLANLSNATLIRADLSYADLSKANLSDANLRDANLSSAKLIGANLSNATLDTTNLSNADLSAANLSNAILMGANLSDANLSDANLSTASLSNASLRNGILSDANLSKAKNLTQTQLDVACGNANTKLLKGLTLKECPTPEIVY